MINSRKKSLFWSGSWTCFFLLSLFFVFQSQSAHSYSALEDQLFIDGYKKVLSRAAVNLRNKKIRLRADIMGYEESEDAHKALDRFKNEIEAYLKIEYQIELVSFVPVFSEKLYRTGAAPVVEFSLFTDERLTLPKGLEDAGDGSSLLAEVRDDEGLSVARKMPADGSPSSKELGSGKALAKAKKIYSENELKSRKHNRAGIALYKNGSYGLAFAEFIDAVILDPGNMQAHFNLGVAYQMQGRYGEAIVEFQKALRIEDRPRIHVMLGAVYIMQERYNDAMSELKNVVFFGTERTRISSAGAQAIKQFANAVKNGALRAPLHIEGHTDSWGTDKINRQISKDRAIAVAMELIAMNNVEPDFVFIRGLGESDPIASNRSEKGRQINRRVEMIIQKKEELH